ncbi:MAG TPA: hypothetical protein VGF67_08090 [Ktedonobacteraceae bacterium]|jgi:hypothetical protein
MYGEMYVVQLIKSAERARSIASALLGVASKERQLDLLKEPDIVARLADALDCSEPEVFAEFARRMHDELMGNRLPPFTLAHLKQLDHHQVQAPLEDLLHCAFGEGLQSLFDPLRIKKTLLRIRAAEASSARLDSRSLLALVLRPEHLSRFEQQYDISFNAWGAFIQEEKWLKTEAVQRLKGLAQPSRRREEEEPLSLLAAFLDNLQAGQEGEQVPTFGKLALVYLRQRLLWVVASLREQAVQYAQKSGALDPAQPAYGHLPAWIEIYERGAVLRAMPYLTPEKKPLTLFLPAANYTKVEQRQEGKADPRKPLVVTAQRTYEKRLIRPSPLRLRLFEKMLVGAFEVRGYLQGQEEAVSLLQCQGLPLDIYEHLIAVIPQLIGADLASAGATLPDRLLNTPVLVPDRLIRLLSLGVKALGPAFAQCLVLCRTPLPIELDLPGRDDLSDQLPYTSLSHHEDIVFPVGAQALVDDLLASYARTGREVTIVQV